MKRRQVVRKGRRRALKAALQPANLPQAPVDLSRQTYLSVPEATVYLRFQSKKALYCWVAEHGIPKCRRGRVLLFLRRDLDEAVQQSHGRAV